MVAGEWEEGKSHVREIFLKIYFKYVKQDRQVYSEENVLGGEI